MVYMIVKSVVQFLELECREFMTAIIVHVGHPGI